MFEITNVYKQSIPALRFIGKQYGDGDRVDGGFGAKWGEWFANNWFAVIEKQMSINTKDLCDDGDAYIGLMRCKDGEPFEYWIGMFVPENTSVPEGFDYVDFQKAELGVCWLYGKESDLYGNECKCAEKLGEKGYKVVSDEKGAWWFFERYACPRFTTPDTQGNVILDICHYVE